MAAYTQFRYLPAGDSALIVELGNEINPDINHKIRGLVFTLEKQSILGIREYVPTYRSLMILYDPSVILFKELVEKVQQIESELKVSTLPEPRCVSLPTPALFPFICATAMISLV